MLGNKKIFHQNIVNVNKFRFTYSVTKLYVFANKYLQIIIIQLLKLINTTCNRQYFTNVTVFGLLTIEVLL